MSVPLTSLMITSLLAIASPPDSWWVTERADILVAGTLSREGDAFGLTCSKDDGGILVVYHPDDSGTFRHKSKVTVAVVLDQNATLRTTWEVRDGAAASSDLRYVTTVVQQALEAQEITVRAEGLPPRRFTTVGMSAAMGRLVETCGAARTVSLAPQRR